MNLYRYCWNHPIVFCDPSGLGPKGDAVGVVLTVYVKSKGYKGLKGIGANGLSIAISEGIDPSSTNDVPQQELMEIDIDDDGLNDYIDEKDDRVFVINQALQRCLDQCKRESSPNCKDSSYNGCSENCINTDKELRDALLWTRGRRNWKMTSHDLK